MSKKIPPFSDGQLDPVFRHSLRECWLILFVWTVCLIWTVGYSWHQGYGSPVEPLELTWGMPRWVFWGVLVPWGLATTFSILFGLIWMVDEPLGEDEEEPEGAVPHPRETTRNKRCSQ